MLASFATIYRASLADRLLSDFTESIREIIMLGRKSQLDGNLPHGFLQQ